MSTKRGWAASRIRPGSEQVAERRQSLVLLRPEAFERVRLRVVDPKGHGAGGPVPETDRLPALRTGPDHVPQVILRVRPTRFGL
jgi:hypothetical protein